MFQMFVLETSSMCNRTCASCLRNSYSDRDAVASWFQSNYMPAQTVARLFTELVEMGYSGGVALNFYNEPLMDERLPEFARLAKSHGFSEVVVCSNGDLLTSDLAARLDGAVDLLKVATYNKGRRQRRRVQESLQRMFQKTRVRSTGGTHRTTHGSGLDDTPADISVLRDLPCKHASRNFIVNHRGDCLLCCDEIVPHFDLGNVHDTPLAELWYSDRRQQIIHNLRHPGGRGVWPYCRPCPRHPTNSRRYQVKVTQ